MHSTFTERNTLTNAQNLDSKRQSGTTKREVGKLYSLHSEIGDAVSLERKIESESTCFEKHNSSLRELTSNVVYVQIYARRCVSAGKTWKLITAKFKVQRHDKASFSSRRTSSIPEDSYLVLGTRIDVLSGLAHKLRSSPCRKEIVAVRKRERDRCWLAISLLNANLSFLFWVLSTADMEHNV